MEQHPECFKIGEGIQPVVATAVVAVGRRGIWEWRLLWSAVGIGVRTILIEGS